MKKFIKHSGYSLVIAGVCFAITNIVISPFVNFEAPFSELLKSTTFFYRMIFAAVTAVFLLFGSIGLYLYHSQIESTKFFRQISFIIAFCGSAFILANEWHQIFVLPEIAHISPETIDNLDSSKDMSSYVIGSLTALTVFSIGWILFTVSLLVSKKLKRLGLVLIIISFFINPIISGFFTPLIGGVFGGILLSIGFSLIGIELIKSS